MILGTSNYDRACSVLIQGQQTTLGSGAKERDPAGAPVHLDRPAVGQGRHRVWDRQDSREALLAGHDRRVGEHAAGFGDDGGDDTEQRSPCRIRGAAHEYVAMADAGEIGGATHPAASCPG